MADHVQSTPTPDPCHQPPVGPRPPGSPSWEEQPVFRWLFLAYLPPSHADHFAAVGELLFDGALASSDAVHDPAAQLRAVAADLEVAARFLDSCDECACGEVPGLINPIIGWRDRLRDLVAEIRAAVPQG